MEEQQENLQESELVRNPRSGVYEGVAYVPVRVRVPEDVYRQQLFKNIREANGDLADMAFFQGIVARIRKTTSWLHHPQAQVITGLEPLVHSAHKEMLHVLNEAHGTHPTTTQRGFARRSPNYTLEELLAMPTPAPVEYLQEDYHDLSVRQRMMQAAYHVPPHRWLDECRTPKTKENEAIRGKHYIDSKRNEEKTELTRLRHLWEKGQFKLSQAAEMEETLWRNNQLEAPYETMAAVRDALETERIH